MIPQFLRGLVMTAIQNLGQVTTIADGDNVAIASLSQGGTYRAPMSAIAAYFATKATLPAGLLSAAGLYGMEGNAPAFSGGVAFADIPNMNAALNISKPAAAAALQLNTLTGELIATRNILAALVWVNCAFVLASPRVLTLGVITGPDVAPVELAPHYAGVGSGAVQYASFGGLAINRANLNQQINAGDKIRLVAKTDQAAVPVNFSSVQMFVLTLDGV